MDFKDLSPELREKAKACTSPEEMRIRNLTLKPHDNYIRPFKRVPSRGGVESEVLSLLLVSIPSPFFHGASYLFMNSTTIPAKSSIPLSPMVAS